MDSRSVYFEKLGKSFPLGKGRHVQALRDFSLKIEPGELLVLAGPSGSGKTTALRLLAGLEVPDAGSIHIGGKDMARVAPKNRGVGMVFQNHALYPHLTAGENLAFGLEIQKLPRAEITRRIRNAAEILHLTELLDKRPDALSGGERQRVALGRAIICQPQILLLDEPFSNLDPQLRAELRAEIKKLRREFGLTILLVTHDQTDALALADRIGVLRGGHLEQLDSPEQIYKRPSNCFVASYFGEMNFLRGRFSNGEFELAHKDHQSIRLSLTSCKPVAAVVESSELLLGFRSAAIVPFEGHWAEREHYSTPFQIDLMELEFAGEFYRIQGKIGSQAVVFNLKNRRQSATMKVVLNLREALVFDATSGGLLSK